jgi:hypothetical protein
MKAKSTRRTKPVSHSPKRSENTQPSDVAKPQSRSATQGESDDQSSVPTMIIDYCACGSGSLGRKKKRSG